MGPYVHMCALKLLTSTPCMKSYCGVTAPYTPQHFLQSHHHHQPASTT